MFDQWVVFACFVSLAFIIIVLGAMILLNSLHPVESEIDDKFAEMQRKAEWVDRLRDRK
jgi:hypothetical protein